MTPASEPLAAARLRRALLAWFSANCRDLPWRRRRDPFRVWVSEVMLQQTQVATVVPYFERFLARFPDAGSLARARLPAVLALWRGLGYYSRARNLHRAARLVAAQGMPRTAAELRALPGFGRYTAAAVASLAFGESVALVDGNVARVLARLLALPGAPGDPGRDERLWDEAGRLLDPLHPGQFNEALMELGALVCSSASPGCAACPLAGFCEARRRGLVERIPAPKVRARRETLELACALVQLDGRLLLARRREEGLFGGLWELPSAQLTHGESGAQALERLGLESVDRRVRAIVRRTLTHRQLCLRLFRCSPPSGALPGYLEQRRFTPGEIAKLGMSAAMSEAIARARLG